MPAASLPSRQVCSPTRELAWKVAGTVTWYALTVFVHVAAMVAFLSLHGVSFAVSIRLRTERDPARVRALLDLSRWSLSPATGIIVLVAFSAGVVAGFVGGWWDRAWLWVSLGVFLALFLVMYPLASKPLHRIREAAGATVGPPFGFGAKSEPGSVDEVELRERLDDYDPRRSAAVFTGAVVLILWLMIAKPF